MRTYGGRTLTESHNPVLHDLTEAHRAVARAAGQLSLTLERRRINQERLIAVLADIDLARDVLSNLKGLQRATNAVPSGPKEELPR